MNKIRKIVLGLSIFAMVIAGCAPKSNSDVKEPVSLGFAPSLNYLAITALEQGYFADEGLEVTVTEYSTGTKALNGLFDGEVDVSVVGTGPLVTASFDRSDFKIFSSVSTHYDLYRIVARKDSGIQTPSGLKGKRVGTSQGSSFHYFLHNFTLENGFSEDDVELVFSGAADQPAALANGDVDAISTREPYISEAISLLGENYIIFSEPGLPSNTLNLIAMDTYLQEKPQVAEKMLRALLRAEEFASQNSSQALSLVAGYLDISEEELQVGWENTTLSVSLNQELILELENIARWSIGQGLTDASNIPNYLDYFYLDGLDTVKPEAIAIIR